MIIVPHPPTAHPTARSRALAERLRTTIADFRMREPKLTDAEVALALREAQPPTSASDTPRAVAALAALAGMLLALGVALFVSRAPRGGETLNAAPVAAVVVALLVGFAVFLVRMRSRG